MLFGIEQPIKLDTAINALLCSGETKRRELSRETAKGVLFQ
jgi:hypothetical protein